MDTNDRQAIEGLFGKLAAVERQSPTRDTEADSFIAGAIARQPGAPYYMAQTIVVQEHALNAAQAQIEQLQADLAAARQGAGQGGGLFSRMFGGGAAAPQRPAYPARPQHHGTGMAPMPGQGGGFLAGAAQTAVGVAGGVLLGNAIAGMFAGPAEAGEPEMEDAMADDGGWDEE